jgi:outer membrane protein OmpA-like peptidoglycan-associated protein
MIELSSHTDSRSSDAFNLQLSQKRAKAAVDYLISKGINKNRLIAIGYGETKLLNKCSNDVNCSEEEHAINRRTEFKILEKK